MKHEHERVEGRDGEWCWACLSEGYRRGRELTYREQALDAIRRHRQQRKTNAALRKAEVQA